MKRTIVVLVLVLLFSNLLNAQIYKGFGVKLGTSIANQKDESFGGNKLSYIYGFTGGIFKETHLYEKLSFVTGINFTQKGTKDEAYINTNENGKYIGSDYVTRKLNYISVELIGKYCGNSEKFSPYIFAGFRMDIFISGKRNFEFASSNSYMDSVKTAWYDFPLNKNLTYGGTFGMGLEYKALKLLTVFIESSFNPDFTYIGEKTYEGFENKTKNYSFEIKTGIKF